MLSQVLVSIQLNEFHVHFVLYISSFNFVLYRSIMDSDGKELISVIQWGCIGNQSIEKYTLKNKVGQEVDIITYGATITSIRIPDKYGNIADIVLGFDSIEGISFSNYLYIIRSFFVILIQQ